MNLHFEQCRGDTKMQKKAKKFGFDVAATPKFPSCQENHQIAMSPRHPNRLVDPAKFAQMRDICPPRIKIDFGGSWSSLSLKAAAKTWNFCLQVERRGATVQNANRMEARAVVLWKEGFKIYPAMFVIKNKVLEP